MKLHHYSGLQNDFLIALEDLESPVETTKLWCAKASADGLIQYGSDKTMHLWNADGSFAEISGNGLRCLAHCLYDEGLVDSEEFVINTDVGERRVWLSGDEQATKYVRAEMGVAQERDGIIDVGNPHQVTLVESLEDLEDIGSPEVNREFIVIVNRKNIHMRVWERGVGETKACGSGACAAAYYAHQNGLVDNIVEVVQPGGIAVVEINKSGLLLASETAKLSHIEI